MIERLGARGDGVARWGASQVFVPFTLPGDRLDVRIGARREGGFAAEPITWHVRTSTAAPQCPHFSACGGCQLQHLPPAEEAAWQVDQVISALARRGLTAPVIPPRPMAKATRRRARFAFSRHRGIVQIGFRGRATRRVVDVRGCAVLLPEIVDLLPDLRRALAGLPAAEHGGELLVTATDAGPDLLLVTQVEPGLEDRETIAALAERLDLARVSWQAGSDQPPEPILRRRPARITFGGVSVEPPPGAFLQASVEAEAEIRDALLKALGDANTLADLFAGCGTFGLPLAATGRRVRAFEAESDLVGALTGAVRAAGLGDRLTAEARDLERAPLAGKELERFEGVILDPPRAGARAQAKTLAASKVPCVAMVSCNPASFARDARILYDGGLCLERIQLIDAFLWSAQIELVGTFVRRS